MIWHYPVLDKGVCVIGDSTLRLNQSIEYKSASEDKISVGKLLEFKEVDGDSVWMNIAEMGKESDTEWVSVRVWKEQFDEGLFTNVVHEDKPSPQKNESVKPTKTKEYPF